MKNLIVVSMVVAAMTPRSAAAAANVLTVLEPPGKDLRPSIGPGQRVLINGLPIEAERFYRVAHSDAEWIREHGYLVPSETEHFEGEVPTIVNEVLADYLRIHSPLSLPTTGRWVQTTDTQWIMV